MEENEVDKMVLTYDQYIYFKEKFDPEKTSLSQSKSLEEIFMKTDIPEGTKNDYSEAFDVLLKHIHNDGVFLGDHKSEACKYINYILYKKVEREIKRNYDKNLANHFKNFLVAYGKLHPERNNRCISDIYNMKATTFNEINALYNVYDKHEPCVPYGKNTIEYGCELFEKFFLVYDSYMFGTQYKSSKFNTILQNIEQYAKKALTLYKTKCNDYSKDLQSPRLFISPPVKEPQINNEEQMGLTRLRSADGMSHHATYGISHTPQRTLLKDISVSEPERENPGIDEENSANDIYSATVDHGENSVHIENHIHPGSLHQETKDTHRRANEEKAPILSRFQGPFRNFYSTGRPYYSGQQEQVEEQAISNEVEMSPPSVMSSISSALKDVDPVPVVGVSGGMGVLFLLSKYTPVGTFFRGRGYRQRIPTRFDGVYPGFYPGFEGFEEGHFPNNHINIAYGPE
ncbi:hypothetical protein PVPAM_110055700 [Plasmodium vivax]|nr:hypothetical protein PVPAM_110055700 [Plasmodium vivax]